jgi:hypothetical protein
MYLWLSLLVQRKCISDKQYSGTKEQNSYFDGKREDVFASKPVYKKGIHVTIFFFSFHPSPI